MGLRVALATDAAAVAAIYAPFVLNTAISFEETPPSADEDGEPDSPNAANTPFHCLRAAARGGGLRYASSHGARSAYRWSANVSVYVDCVFHVIAGTDSTARWA